MRIVDLGEMDAPVDKSLNKVR